MFEFTSGGELFYHLRNYGSFQEPFVRFYAGELILAVEYLHAHGVVHRSLRPESVLFTSTGHVRLVGFDYAKRVAEEGSTGGGRTFTFCGAPDYVAPEMLADKGYGLSVDWWAFGVLLYELIMGYPPFCDVTPFKVYQKIIKGEVSFAGGAVVKHVTSGGAWGGGQQQQQQHHHQQQPGGRKAGASSAGSGVSTKRVQERQAVCILIRRLLKVDRRKRMGCGKKGSAAQVKADRFFGGGMDWSALQEEQCVPPWVPKLAGDADLRHFKPVTKMVGQDDAGEVEGEATKLFKKIADGERSLLR